MNKPKPAARSVTMGMEWSTANELKAKCRDLESRCARHVRELESANRLLNQEIEKHRLAQRRLFRSEGCFRSMFQQAPLGAVILETKGTILKANNAICRMLDYTETELVGRSLDRFLSPLDAGALASGFQRPAREPEGGNVLEARVLTRSL